MKQKILPPGLLLLFIFCHPHTYGQTWKWATGSISPKNYIESAPITVDSSGNVYETGIIQSYQPDSAVKSYFGTDTIRGARPVLVSADSNGHYRWAKPISYGYINRITMGPTGDLYLFGVKSGIFYVGADTVFCPPTGAAFCARLDTAGHIKWVKFVGAHPTAHFDATGDVDGDGNVYIASSFTNSSIVIGGTTLINADATTSDVFIAKLDTNGDPVWAKSFGGNNFEYVTGLSVTASGSVVIAGAFRSPVFSIGSASFYNDSGLYYDHYYVVKYDLNGTFVWGNTITNHSTFTSLGGVAFDSWGNCYVTGAYKGPLTTGSMVLPAPHYFGMYLIQYDGTGSPSWFRTIGESPASYGIAPDMCGNVWVCTATGNDIDNSFMINYDINGTFRDSVQFRAGGDDVSGIAVDNKGNIYFGGDYLNPVVRFGADSLVLQDSTNETLMLAKYSYPFCADVKAPPVLHSPPAVQPSAGISLFPNPASEQFTICTGLENIKIVHIVISDPMGRTVAAYWLPASSAATINVQHLQPGVYICRIETSDHTMFTQKLTVAR